MFSRWDAEWYLGMAKHGYVYEPGKGLHSNTAFFPLYPALMTLVAKVTGGSDVSILSAGLPISNRALLAALAALVRLDFDEEVARRTVLYVALFAHWRYVG